METINSLFLNSFKKYRNKVLFKMNPRFRQIIWTYENLENYSSGIAKILEDHKIGYQDRVIIISQNSPFWVGTFLGGLLKGCILVPLNPQSTKDFVKRIIKETNAKFLFKSSNLLSQEIFDIPTINIDFEKHMAFEKMEYEEEKVVSSDIAEIVYTSGTTGDPKGVILTHKNIISNLESFTTLFEIKPSDKTVSILPLFHMYEQTGSLLTVIKFGLNTMFAANVSSKEIQKCLQEQKATKMLVVPEFLETILRKIESVAQEAGKEKTLQKMFNCAQKLPVFMRRIIFRKVHKMFGGKLSLIASGGSALHPEVERKWFAMGFTILQGYGLTETSPVSAANTPANHKLGSCGQAIPGVKIEIADNKEVLISGPNVFCGYYRNEEKTKATFDEKGRFKTGDLGHIDEDGFLFISGRSKYMILTSSGENVYPEDIETELKKISQIRDAAVVGFKDNGREIIYAVLLTDRNDGKEIIEETNKHLAPYQHIAAWSIWPESDFPRSATRKVKKEEILKWLKDKKTITEKPKVEVAAHPVTKLLSAVSGKDIKIIHDDSLLYADLFFDSLMRIELVTRIDEMFDVEIPENLINQNTRVKDLKELIEKGVPKIKIKRFKKWLLSPVCIVLRFVFLQIFIIPFSWILFGVKSKGKENLKGLQNPVIFMPNHVSYADTLLVLRALPLRFRSKIAVAAALDFMYKRFWFIAPLLDLFFNTYPMPRREEDNIRPGLENTAKILDHNFSVLIFPEGKISENGEIDPLKKGAGLLAMEMDVPIIPIYLKDVHTFMATDKILPRHLRKSATVVFGKPIYFSPSTSYEDATNRIYEEMKNLGK
ncbi:TPA: hypothetical protein DEO28_04475 [Candidatus Dependentiae bacterium]|nr:MAG: Acyltransferase family protein [candidate division TM6 bacterium GW2011_GWE2_31_21]KKP53810.1 MAG: Acyltransferase family protein [candidate division TM6 bacterium GW2011_GWF2_33_332]HBS47590.1 hypothetical protein [Candidatus Dependentiae bacterium]HBZ73739.1 hypothetical protein [Candidatus Dependentiae bacterium]